MAMRTIAISVYTFQSMNIILNNSQAKEKTTRKQSHPKQEVTLLFVV